MLANHQLAAGGGGSLFGALGLRLLQSASRSRDLSSSASPVFYEPEDAELCYSLRVAIPIGLEFYFVVGVAFLLVGAFVGVRRCRRLCRAIERFLRAPQPIRGPGRLQ